MVIMDNGNEVYGEKRSFIDVGRKRLKCGKVGKVKYGEVELMIMKVVKWRGSIRLREVVKSLEKYMNVELDMYRIKERLGDKVVERKFVESIRGDNGEINVIMRVEDWVVD